MLATADKLSNQADELEIQNQDVESQKLFGIYEIIEDLLQQNGFALTHTSSRCEECVTKNCSLSI